jgi:hypothetical protein
MLKVIGKMNGSTPVAMSEPEYVNRVIDGDVVDLGDKVAYVKGGHLWFDIVQDMESWAARQYEATAARVERRWARKEAHNV